MTFMGEWIVKSLIIKLTLLSQPSWSFFINQTDPQAISCEKKSSKSSQQFFFLHNTKMPPVCEYFCKYIYLVGPTGGVESIRSTNKQRVFILLQQNLDEIVTLVLERQRKGNILTFKSPATPHPYCVGLFSMRGFFCSPSANKTTQCTS